MDSFSFKNGKWQKWLPSRGNVLFTLVVLGSLFYAQSVGAIPLPASQDQVSQAPGAVGDSDSTISYQGYLTDSNEAPVNATLDMVFRLYSTKSGGTPLWSKSLYDIQVSDGLFSALLGSSQALEQSLFGENSNLWAGDYSWK